MDDLSRSAWISEVFETCGIKWLSECKAYTGTNLMFSSSRPNNWWIKIGFLLCPANQYMYSQCRLCNCFLDLYCIYTQYNILIYMTWEYLKYGVRPFSCESRTVYNRLVPLPCDPWVSTPVSWVANCHISNSFLGDACSMACPSGMVVMFWENLVSPGSWRTWKLSKTNCYKNIRLPCF